LLRLPFSKLGAVKFDMRTEKHACLHVNCLLFLSDFNQNRQVIVKLYIKFHENPLSCTTVIYGYTSRYGEPNKENVATFRCDLARIRGHRDD
jgi:hypothetical protein